MMLARKKKSFWREKSRHVVGSCKASNLFSTRRICSHEQRKKQFDWLTANTNHFHHPIKFIFCFWREKTPPPISGKRASFRSQDPTYNGRRELMHFPQCSRLEQLDINSCGSWHHCGICLNKGTLVTITFSYDRDLSDRE